jgi:hypothetical protein
MRLRWVAAVVLVALLLPLTSCSSPTTSPTKPSTTDKQPVNKPNGEVG